MEVINSFLVPFFWPVFNSIFLSMVLGAWWLIFWVMKVLDYTILIFTGFGRLCSRPWFSDNPFSLYSISIISIIIIIIIIITIRVGFMILANSKVKFFFILVNGFQPLAHVIRNTVLGLAKLLNPPLFNIIILYWDFSSHILSKLRYWLVYNLFVSFMLYAYIASCRLTY